MQAEFDYHCRQCMYLTYCSYGVISPLTSAKHVRKVVGGFGRKAVLVLKWESQETRVRHRPPWYDLSCSISRNNNRVKYLIRLRVLCKLSLIIIVGSVCTLHIAPKILRFIPFQNKPWFWRVFSGTNLKTLWEMEKLLVTSYFSFSHSVF